MHNIKIEKSNSLPNAIDIHNVKDFNLKHIFECGQCFRWNPTNDGLDGYIGCAGDKGAKLYFELDKKNILTIQSKNELSDANFWINYLDLCTDYSEIKCQLEKIDKYLAASVEFGYGIRLLKQELFETLISFILSANNNIPRIKGCVEKISASYGNITDSCTNTLLSSFPSCDVLAKVTADEISECCHAGYRCVYIEKTCKTFMDSKISVDSLKKMSFPDARACLRQFCGVGPKVADCILLFTGSHMESFPIDVWIKRVMEELYFDRNASIKEIEQFAQNHFGKLAGYGQQYLFYYAREHMEELRNII